MTRLRGAVGVLLVTLLLSSCSDDPPDAADPTSAPPTSSATDPSPPPPPTSTSSPSETATSEPVSLTPEETVRAWVAARNQLLTTGNATAVEGLATTSCQSCRDLNDGIEDVYAAGGSYRTEGWVVNGAKRRPDFDSSGRVSTALIFSEGVVRDDADARPRRYPEEKNFVDFTLRRVEGRWLVTDVVFLA